MSKILTFLKTLFAWTLHFFSFLSPRSKKVWVFIDHRHGGVKEMFFGNAKYLFLYASNNKSQYGNPKIIWITPDKNFANKLCALGHTSYTSYSLIGIFYSLRAKYIFANDHLRLPNWMLSGGAKIIHLWHGMPLKKFGFQRTKDPMLSKALGKFLYPDTYQHRTSKVVVASEFQIPIFIEALRTSKENILIAEYPRNSVFSGQPLPNGALIDVDKDLLDIIENKKYAKHLLYAPTYRRGKSKEEFEEMVDFEDISKWLVTNNYFLIVALHPRLLKSSEENKLKNIYFIKKSDIYPILPKIDVLISDYSSILVDFLLADKPIVFYAYDLEEYAEKEGLIIDYKKDTPGEKAYNKDEFIPALKKAIANDTWKEKRAEIRKRYHAQGPADGSDSILKSVI